MTDYQALARADATAAGINPDVFVAQINAESGFNPNAVSSAGAIGIAQFMPATAAGIGFDPHDPTASLKQAALYDARNVKTYGGDYRKMLAAYNAGNGTVDSAVKSQGSGWFNALPAETKNYVLKILGTGSFGMLSKCGPQDCECIYGVGTSQADQCNKQLIGTPSGIGVGGDTKALPSIPDPISSALQPLLSALPSFGVKAALFMAALMFAIIGLWILTRNPASDTQSAISTQLNNAAIGIGSHRGKMKGGKK